MRLALLLAAVCGLLPAACGGEPPAKAVVDLRSPVVCPGLPLAESKTLVYAVQLAVQADAKGEGKGTLTLTTTPPNFDEYGDFVTGREIDLVNRARDNARPPVALDCTVEYVKAGAVGRVNEAPTRRSVFRVKGPKITTPLFVATEGPGLTSGRLLVHDAAGRVEYVVELTELKPVKAGGLPVPCHPGCFPAGTLVRVPAGTTRIDRIREGDTVTTIDADGRAGRGTVGTVFRTTNKLVEVRTATATLLTTDAQPLNLAAGGFRKAGELKAGDRLWTWHDGKRAEAVVREVAATGRTEPVFNLIVGDSAVFVANGFLARGKPPAAAGK